MNIALDTWLLALCVFFDIDDKLHGVDKVEALINKIVAFRDARDWKQFHNIKDLVISLTLESSELLENFQWKSSETALKENMDNIKDELADVLIYAMLIAHDLDIDIEDTVLNKLKKNQEKYPVDKFKGSSKKYTQE